MPALHMAQPSHRLHTTGLLTKRKQMAKHIDDDASSAPVAHTLTACTRCRSRKTRCDPGLPRCGPCERTNSTCEYYDSTRGHNVNRNYVIYLQQKVRELEEELDRVENEDAGEDADAMMRAATVRVVDTKEAKYLGPSSGIAISRLVMQLAKQFADSKSIKDIVDERRAAHIKELYNQEQAKPTSKIYPMISDVAATELPNRGLTDLLVQLYKLKVQPQYPVLHEPTLDRDVEALYTLGDAATPFQQFICRMVIAISLQKMDTQYAGLADSYYLAALQHLDTVVRPMDLQTLQCFALMAEYSLLTPTRTAIYYVVGLAVRLVQALGLNEEKTITRGRADGTTSALEVDMRRRLFWCILTMELGLAHSLGRPSILATSQDHIDVGWFETCDDEYITPEGIDPSAPRPTLKKWIAIHFFKMRMHQLEIRRKLYLRKRAEPKDDTDPWFIRMDAKITAWRDASPSQDEGVGLDKVWFIGRYHTMIVFMYRPSPQVPRPSLAAAFKCYDACEYNINMQREQINKRNVDLTWIFTRSIFMTINTILWTLSYVEVRRKHKREEVESLLAVAMDALTHASERWPGVASAIQLYSNLIVAVLKIYEKDGDVPISATTPSDAAASPSVTHAEASRSATTSPATTGSHSIATPPEPFGFMSRQGRHSVEMPPPVPYQSDASPAPVTTPSSYGPPSIHSNGSVRYSSSESVPTMQTVFQQNSPHSSFSQANELPSFENTWASSPAMSMAYSGAANSSAATTPGPMPLWPANAPVSGGMDAHSANMYGFSCGMAMDGVTMNDAGGVDQQYLPQYWDMESAGFGSGLTQMQQEELLHSLETDGMLDIQHMISSTLSSIAPKPPSQ